MWDEDESRGMKTTEDIKKVKNMKVISRASKNEG